MTLVAALLLATAGVFGQVTEPSEVTPTTVPATSPAAFRDPYAGQAFPGGNENSSPANSTQTPASPLTSGGMDSTRVMLALSGVIILIFILRYGAKRILPGGAVLRNTRTIKILARCPVAPKQQVMLIQLGKRLLLVGDSGSQLNSLCNITDGDEVSAILAQIHEEAAAQVGRFDLTFGRAKKKFDEHSVPEETAFDPTHEINDPAAEQTQRELAGLSDKVRDLARQLGR
jgi:flagellar biogenesis protein FliO